MMATVVQLPDECPKAVLYLRVARPTNHNTAIAAQRDACQRLAAQLGATIWREYIEHGPAGAIEERPALQQMLDELAAHRCVRYVVTYDHSRLAIHTRTWTCIAWRIQAVEAVIATVRTAWNNGE